MIKVPSALAAIGGADHPCMPCHWHAVRHTMVVRCGLTAPEGIDVHSSDLANQAEVESLGACGVRSDVRHPSHTSRFGLKILARWTGCAPWPGRSPALMTR